MRRLIKRIPKSFYAVSIVLIVVMSMTVVCASLSTQMLLNGDATVRVAADIRITNVEMLNPVSGAYETVNLHYSKDTADLYSTLPALNSTISFKITVENTSNDVYVISAIGNTLSNNQITSNVTDFEGTIIDANDSEELTVTYQYDSEVSALPADTTQTANLSFTFERPNASMIEYSSNYTSQTNVQDALDELFSVFE